MTDLQDKVGHWCANPHEYNYVVHEPPPPPADQDCDELRCRNKHISHNVVQLPCGHKLCMGCIVNIRDKVRGYFASTRDPVGPVARKFLELVVVIICPKQDCRRPHILKEEKEKLFIGFREIIRYRFTVLRQFEHNLAYFQADVCENQRRTLFGRFSAENLLVADFCGPWSNDAGAPYASLQEAFHLPTSDWVWLEEWTTSSSGPAGNRVCDPQGWGYAWSFSGPFASSFGPLRLVRRRKKQRIRIRISEHDNAVKTILDSAKAGAL
eukprot:NODE_255_length_1043_cov_320.768478_g252_i0.p1 GENE.NODE_255_length_1043_cov_320.768478_g252_i0~~NODE_255_length_1043_cov_320.768478_g252_i0.p1  ORF type:complete len:277 (-),score=23.11 NODE_255_length_1043_cov_320.768478_g252_i0:211-1011(-)